MRYLTTLLRGWLTFGKMWDRAFEDLEWRRLQHGEPIPSTYSERDED